MTTTFISIDPVEELLKGIAIVNGQRRADGWRTALQPWFQERAQHEQRLQDDAEALVRRCDA